MTYNETLNFIENELKNIKIQIYDNPNLILSRRFNGKIYLTSIGTYLENELSKKILTPWVSKEELLFFYKETSHLSHSRKKIRLKQNNVTIYSSIIHKKSCIINDIIYIHLMLNNNGLNNSYINPNILIKFDMNAFLICAKLISNLDIEINNYKNIDMDINDKVIFNL